jgi:hypothetical protein
MRVSGFGIIRNYKKLTRRTKLPLIVESSDDEECASTPRTTSVFQDGNEPDATQAEFPQTPGWNLNGSAKTPKHDLLFEGVIINSKDWEFKTRMSTGNTRYVGKTSTSVYGTKEPGARLLQREVHRPNA